MKQSVQKFISSAVMVSTSLFLTGAGVATTAFAGQATDAQATLSVVTTGDVSNHTIAFENKLTTSIKKVKFEYARTASTGNTVPDSFNSDTNAVKSSVTVGGSSDTSNWTLDRSVNGTLLYTATTAVSSPAEGTAFVFVTDSITNNTITGGTPCDTVTESDTCYIRITTLDASDVVIDTAVTTYTLISPITVSATVDPTLTFTITGVNSGTTNDANQGGATSVTTTATTVPFGNVTVGTAKRAQHSLSVTTNANNGYFVYNKFTNATSGSGKDGLMTGTQGSNNIDGFKGAGGSAAWPEDGTPAAWATPTGTSGSVDSAWIGVRSNNAGLTAGFGSSNVYAPAFNGSGSGKQVMKKTTPDNGTTPSYVTFQIQANAYQPADSYTGTMVYNVVASY